VALMIGLASKRQASRHSFVNALRRRVFVLPTMRWPKTSWLFLLMSILALPWLLEGEVEAKLSAGDYEIIGEALHAIEMDEWPRAERLMTSIEDPLAVKLFQWIMLIEDRNDADFDTLATFIIDNPDWPRIDELQERAEARLIDSADKALTVALFDKHEPLSTRGHIRFAEALFADGKDDEALQHVRRAWVHGDFSRKEEAAFIRRHGRHLRPGDHSSRLEQLLWDRNWRDANRMLPRVSKAYAKLGKARIVLQTQSPGVDQAIHAVPEELAGDPGLLFDRARWRRLKRKHDGAKEILSDPPDRLVRPERWWFERSYHVRRAIEAREFEDAYKLVSRHGQLSGGDYAEAEWLSGWLALRFINRPKTAFRHFVRLYDRVVAPVRQARAAYWAGRSAAALGDQAGAVAWYRRAALHSASFYGQLARVELNGEAVLTLAPEPTVDERAAFEAKELAALARMLIAVDDRRYLDDVLKELAEKAETASEIGMIADYANAAGRPALLARLGRSAAFDGKVYEKAAFPIPKIEGLLKPAAEVEPSLLLGVARQESMFRRDAKSPAGARGLLQLIPSTARLVAKRSKQPYDRDRLLADHDYNAALGGHYLELLIERFDGALPLVLAAYNAGPLRVKRWIETHGDPRESDRHAMVDWIELIPYAETRNYVQRVLEGHEVYRRRLAEADVELIDYPGINLLHPPPMPVARPANLVPDVVVTQAETSASLDVHRPRLKPLDTAVGGPLTTVVKPSFNDAGAKDVASDEGEPVPEAGAPKL
jgi:soluble lytic murein transglycosylase